MPRWTQEQLRDAVAAADSLSDVLRHFGLRPAGGNHRALRRWLAEWEISTGHFTHGGDRFAAVRPAAQPLDTVLVEHSTYDRGSLKRRLYAAGLKARRCELCGQADEWRGRPMSLILDHVNGVADDNRLENLRIVCPNCNATLATHCGKNRAPTKEPRPCALCGASFRPRTGAQLYCSRECGTRARWRPRPETRKVQRPPHEQLLEEIATSSWSAVARKYGVSCNAVRKWVRTEERRRAALAHPGEPAPEAGRTAA